MGSGLTDRPEGPGKCLLVVEDVVAMALCSAQPTAGISTDFAQRIARTFVDGVDGLGFGSQVVLEQFFVEKFGSVRGGSRVAELPLRFSKEV